MRNSYHLTNPDGKTYEFVPDGIDLSDFEQYGTGKVHSDGFETVATKPIDGGESPAFGRGDSTNADDAEAFLWLDARMETDDDGDGTGDQIEKGVYMLRVVNESGREVTGGIIHRGRLSRARKGNPDESDHGDWGIPFPRQYLMDGYAEIPPGKGYQVALQLKTRNGTANFNLPDSAMLAEGYVGEPIN